MHQAAQTLHTCIGLLFFSDAARAARRSGGQQGRHRGQALVALAVGRDARLLQHAGVVVHQVGPLLGWEGLGAEGRAGRAGLGCTLGVRVVVGCCNKHRKR